MAVINIGQNYGAISPMPGKSSYIVFPNWKSRGIKWSSLLVQTSRDNYVFPSPSYYFAVKGLVMPTLQSRPPLLWLLLLFLFCFMSALESSSLWSMTLVMLGHAADSGNFQQGQVAGKGHPSSPSTGRKP